MKTNENVYCKIIHNNQNMVTTQMFIDRGNSVYTYNGILFSLRKKEILSFVTVWMGLEDIILILIGMHACSFSHVQLFATPWTVAQQDPLSMKFSRQEY